MRCEMGGRAQVHCQTPQCEGILGATVGGEFYPAAHLRPSRDLWLRRDGVVVVRCSFCRGEHLVRTDGERVQVRMAA